MFGKFTIGCMGGLMFFGGDDGVPILKLEELDSSKGDKLS
jgi:hypothetical protein